MCVVNCIPTTTVSSMLNKSNTVQQVLDSTLGNTLYLLLVLKSNHLTINFNSVVS